MLQKAEEEGIETAWDRYEKQLPQCSFGQLGICCRNCNMGPCRIDPFGEGADRGICGATADIIVARNLLRTIAAGAAAHSDHARDAVLTFKKMSEGEAGSYRIKDEAKLLSLASEYGIPAEGKSHEEVASELADALLLEFGKQDGHLLCTRRAPGPRLKLWTELGIEPRGIDREIVECMHRTHMGVDNNATHILLQGLRTGLSDGWGGSMIATDVQDILFGTPQPRRSTVNLGVLSRDKVNVIVHGHEPILSEMIVEAAEDPELLKLAQEKGAIRNKCCRNLLYWQRDPDAARDSHSRKLPSAGTGSDYRSCGSYGCGCPVRHAVSWRTYRLLSHKVYIHIPKSRFSQYRKNGIP